LGHLHHGHGGEKNQKGRPYPSDASQVEFLDRNPACVGMLLEQEPRYDETTYHEENVDAYEAAGKPFLRSVHAYDGHNCERAETNHLKNALIHHPRP
jgi:hypothetical protein